MALEDKHLDKLQNIEFVIVQAYREDPGIRDVDVIQALEEAIKYFLRKNRDSSASPPENLPDRVDQILANLLIVLKWREQLDKEKAPSGRPRFSRALREPTLADIYLACLRKIEKSAKRWHKRNGERGYLDFVINYVG